MWYKIVENRSFGTPTSNSLMDTYAFFDRLVYAFLLLFLEFCWLLAASSWMVWVFSHVDFIFLISNSYWSWFYWNNIFEKFALEV